MKQVATGVVLLIASSAAARETTVAPVHWTNRLEHMGWSFVTVSGAYPRRTAVFVREVQRSPGDVTRMSVRLEYEQVSGAKSSVLEAEFQCRTRGVTYLQRTDFAGQNLSLGAETMKTPAKRLKAAPDSVETVLQRLACGEADPARPSSIRGR